MQSKYLETRWRGTDAMELLSMGSSLTTREYSWVIFPMVTRTFGISRLLDFKKIIHTVFWEQPKWTGFAADKPQTYQHFESLP